MYFIFYFLFNIMCIFPHLSFNGFICVFYAIFSKLFNESLLVFIHFLFLFLGWGICAMILGGHMSTLKLVSYVTMRVPGTELRLVTRPVLCGRHLCLIKFALFFLFLHQGPELELLIKGCNKYW